MKVYANTIATVALLGAVAAPSAAHATGLGNLTYTQAELQKPIANFGGEGVGRWATGPSGSNTVLMLRDVMVVMGSLDSGKPPGSFHIYDVKDPRNPKLLKTYDGTPQTAVLRELHAMPVAMIDGKDILVFPSQTGLQFFDFTDPMNPAPVASIALAGVNGGDYDNAAWMLSWEWPYVFAGATGNGVFVVDATDPAHPTMVRKIATGEAGNHRIGPTYAAGNYLVVANMDQVGTQVTVLDVGNPAAPFLLATGSTPASLYSMLVVGDHIYGAGTNGDYAFMKWTPKAVSVVGQGKSGADRGGYCTYQSGFAICGQSSEGYKKWDTRVDTAPKLVGIGTDPAGVGGDFDFATILGNLVYLGNDHGSGAAFIPHTMEPDSTPPQVVNVFPSDQDVKQPLSTRVTVFFSEDIDLGTVSAANLIVRKSGGAAIDGVFSKSSFNAISFGPKEPLTAGTTYEVVVPSGGLKDLVGNVIASTVTVRFSTGATVDAVGSATPDAGAGGADAGSKPSADAGSKPSVDASTATETGAGTGTGGAGGSSGAAGASAAGGSMVPAGGGGAGPVAGSAGAPTTGSGGTGGAAAGESPSAPPESGGCGCSVPGRASRGGILSLLMAALAVSTRQVRGRRRRNESLRAA